MYRHKSHRSFNLKSWDSRFQISLNHNRDECRVPVSNVFTHVTSSPAPISSSRSALFHGVFYVPATPLHINVTCHALRISYQAPSNFISRCRHVFIFILATIKCSYFAEANIIRTTQGPMAITYLLFDRHYKRLPGDDITTLSTAVSVGGLLLSC